MTTFALGTASGDLTALMAILVVARVAYLTVTHCDADADAGVSPSDCR